MMTEQSTKPTHTPGPWARRDTPDYAEIVADDGTVVALVGQLRDVGTVAAAPELLAALKRVLAVADRKTDEFDAARAAIAKAEGGSK